MNEESRREFLNELSRFIECLKRAAAELFRRIKEFHFTVREQFGKAESRLDARKGWDVLLPDRKRTVNRYRPIKTVARSALQ
ncbi:hypothetical protein Q0N12_04265 [Rossellomorea marisflavi]|uniref:hypothetical protein n=1 Tax=Rossellomorea marisflavi TaxID=189381 RepID=UPI003459FD8F